LKKCNKLDDTPIMLKFGHVNKILETIFVIQILSRKLHPVLSNKNTHHAKTSSMLEVAYTEIINNA